MNTKIKELLDKLPAHKLTLASKVRSIVLGVHEKIKEDIKWGDLTFIYKGNMAAIGNHDTVDYLIPFFYLKAQD